MFEELFNDVETSTDLNRDPRPPTSPIMNAQSRDSAAPWASKKKDPGHVHLPSIKSASHYSMPNDALADTVHRLQSQVNYSTSICESQRRDVARIEGAVDRLQIEMGNVIAVLESVRAETDARQRAPVAAPERPHGADLDMLSSKIQSVANKANEVDGLRLQVDSLTRRLRQLEGHGSPPPGAPAADIVRYEQRHHSTSNAPLPPPPPYGGTTPAAENRSLTYQTPTETRLPPPSLLHSGEPRPRPDHSLSEGPRTLPSFRAIDAASTMSSWRHASFHPHAQAPPLTLSASTHTGPTERPQATGWAAVNISQNGKRGPTADERPVHESPKPVSPKRQKLATLMPRTSYGEHNTSSGYQSATNHTPDSVSSFEPSRHPSQDSVAHHFGASNNSTAPSSTTNSTGPNPLRFVQFPSGPDHGTQEPWRPDLHPQRPPLVPLRGRGRSGRGRGHNRKSEGTEGETEHSTPEWSGASDSYYHPAPLHSPNDSRSRASLTRQSTGHSAGLPEQASADQAEAYSDTQQVPAGTHASSPGADDGSLSGPAKKTRTKPIRNSEGVLIRKDGRPDMRSVSSAINLRKVHAKKEAERATELGVFSVAGSAADGENAPATAPSTDGPDGGPGDGRDGETCVQDHHREDMRKISPHGINGAEHPIPDGTKVAEVKQENSGTGAKTAVDGERQHRKQSEDVVMTDGDIVHDHVDKVVDAESHERDGEKA